MSLILLVFYDAHNQPEDLILKLFFTSKGIYSLGSDLELLSKRRNSGMQMKIPGI